MYRWRRLTEDERRRVLLWRQQRGRPLHSPHHLDQGRRHYLITASCYEHVSHIGHSPERMTAFAGALLDAAHAHATSVAAWVVLPNHYHMVVATAQLSALVTTLGQLHGRTSRKWNSEENRRGRQVWCKCAETGIKSLDHLRATLNYVHHNPVKHGYVKRWTDWHWSSAGDYVAEVGREEAARLWREYPITEYGHGWDDAEM